MLLSASIQYGAGLKNIYGEKNSASPAVKKKLIEIKKYLTKYL